VTDIWKFLPIVQNSVEVEKKRLLLQNVKYMKKKLARVCEIGKLASVGGRISARSDSCWMMG